MSGSWGGWRCPGMSDVPRPKHRRKKGLPREATSGDLGCLLHAWIPLIFLQSPELEALLPSTLLIPRRVVLPESAK